MAIKLITLIKRWIERDLKKEHPYIQILEQRELKNATYYDLKQNDFRFCLILKDLKAGPKVTWVFHRELSEDETDYWKGRYHFKLIDIEGEYTESIIKINNILNKNPVKIVMTRIVGSMRIFTKDLKWILLMENTGDPDE